MAFFGKMNNLLDRIIAWFEAHRVWQACAIFLYGAAWFAFIAGAWATLGG